MHERALSPYFEIQRVYSFSADEAAEKLAAALEPSDFGVVARFDSLTGCAPETAEQMPRLLILRLFHPRSAYERYLLDPAAIEVFRCTALIKELGFRRTLIELRNNAPADSIRAEPSSGALLQRVTRALSETLETLGPVSENQAASDRR